MAQIHMIVRYQDHEMEFKQDIVEQDGYVSARHNYKVPRILWENMEAVLLAQSKKYIEELAKILQVNANINKMYQNIICLLHVNKVFAT